MITVAEETELLADGYLMAEMPKPVLRQLAFASERFTFFDGETIIEQGGQANSGYLLLSGEIDVYLTQNDETQHLATLGPGFLIGDHALIAGGDYKVTVRAKGQISVLRIMRSSFLRMLEGDDEAMTNMMRLLMERKAEVEKMLSIKLD